MPVGLKNHLPARYVKFDVFLSVPFPQAWNGILGSPVFVELHQSLGCPQRDHHLPISLTRSIIKIRTLAVA